MFEDGDLGDQRLSIKIKTRKYALCGLNAFPVSLLRGAQLAAFKQGNDIGSGGKMLFDANRFCDRLARKYLVD